MYNCRIILFVAVTSLSAYQLGQETLTGPSTEPPLCASGMLAVAMLDAIMLTRPTFDHKSSHYDEGAGFFFIHTHVAGIESRHGDWQGRTAERERRSPREKKRTLLERRGPC